MADNRAHCPRCLEFEDQVRELHERLAASGQYVTYSPGANPALDVEHELRRWLAVTGALMPQPDSAPDGRVWRD